MFVTVIRHGVVVGCLEYDWVSDYLDMLRADQFLTHQGGTVLYISNVEITERDPSIIWELKRQLPNSRWIVGLTDAYEVRAPKGVPYGFYAAVA